MKKVVIAGGNGFIGSNLSTHFKEKGVKVIVLTRENTRIDDEIYYQNWDAKTIGKWTEELEEADLVINLTGKSVDCRYTEKNKEEILSSRIDATKIIGEAINKCTTPPPLWINASTATIYRHSFDKAMTEKNGEIGDDFSMTVAKEWEKAFFEAETSHTRKVVLRISLVLGYDGGVLPILSTLSKFGLGGKHGSGKQMFAWIHIKDLIKIIDFVVTNKNLSGIFNCTAPETIDNRQFMKTLRTVVKMPFGIPTPEFLLKIGTFILRTEPELILKSRYVYPKNLLDEGYQFEYTKSENALINLLQK